MANDMTIDFSGVTLDLSKNDLVNALLPQIIQNLSTNPTLLAQLTNVITQKVLQQARSTGSALGQYAGGTQSQSATSINTNAVPR